MGCKTVVVLIYTRLWLRLCVGCCRRRDADGDRSDKYAAKGSGAPPLRAHRERTDTRRHGGSFFLFGWRPTRHVCQQTERTLQAVWEKCRVPISLNETPCHSESQGFSQVGTLVIR